MACCLDVACMTEAAVWVSMSTLLPLLGVVLPPPPPWGIARRLGAFNPEDPDPSRFPAEAEADTLGDADLDADCGGPAFSSSEDLEALRRRLPVFDLAFLTLAFRSCMDEVTFSGDRSCWLKFVLFTFIDLTMLCLAMSSCRVAI